MVLSNGAVTLEVVCAESADVATKHALRSHIFFTMSPYDFHYLPAHTSRPTSGHNLRPAGWLVSLSERYQLQRPQVLITVTTITPQCATYHGCRADRGSKLRLEEVPKRS